MRSLAAKRRILVVLLGLFALWPIVHGELVARYHINPWRLFGWAMYCVPTYEPQVRFFGKSGDRSGEISLPPSPRVEVERIRFVRQRGQLGEWASGDLLASEIFAAYPDLDELVIAVSHPIYRSDERAFEAEVSRRSYVRRTEP